MKSVLKKVKGQSDILEEKEEEEPVMESNPLARGKHLTIETIVDC